jgi:hypothetical protein
MSMIPPDPPQRDPSPAVVRLRDALLGAAACGALVAVLVMTYAEASLALADQQLVKAQAITERANALMDHAEAMRADLCGGDE